MSVNNCLTTNLPLFVYVVIECPLMLFDVYSQGAGINFEYKDFQSEEDLGLWDSMACRNYPKYPVLSNLTAPVYDFSRKTESYLSNNAKLLNFGIMIKGVAELDNTEHMGWFSKSISI